MIINNNELEFIEDTHTYLVDGIIVPSITQIIKMQKGSSYENVAPSILKRASEKGTEIHKAIEDYCTKGIESDLQEVYNFKFLMKQYGFVPLENEVPVILYDKEGEPIGAGRLDMVIGMNDKIGGADIKRTSVIDKDYVCLQLNLYRLAYRQCYQKEWEFLRVIHLREDKRKFVEVPINEEYTWKFIENIKGETNE